MYPPGFAVYITLAISDHLMNEFIGSIKPFFELLYFFAGIFLLVGLGFGYQQLRLIKQDIRIRNKRAAAEKAIEACDAYFSDYIALSGVQFKEQKAANVPVYKGPIGDFTSKSIAPNLLEGCVARMQLMSWVPALNRLEAMAAYFTAGVADESTGFKVIGRTFCSTVESNYDLISLSRRGEPNAYWSNLVELYSLWRPRLTKSELDLAKQGIEKSISALQQKTVSPIGTDG
jgi:hypothetical protein